MGDDCLFCEIALGVTPAEIVAERETTLAFMDINPWRHGHALVIPRRHATNLWEINAADLAAVYSTARDVAGLLQERLGCNRVILWNSCGATAGQVISHFHLHAVPADDDVVIPPRPREPIAATDVAAVASQLRGR